MSSLEIHFTQQQGCIVQRDSQLLQSSKLLSDLQHDTTQLRLHIEEMDKVAVCKCQRIAQLEREVICQQSTLAKLENDARRLKDDQVTPFNF